jgi:hypothetical protein
MSFQLLIAASAATNGPQLVMVTSIDSQVWVSSSAQTSTEETPWSPYSWLAWS